MKKNFLKTSNWIYGLLVGLLGFSNSCQNNTSEYGMPEAHFIISGKVTDQHNTPIKGIEVNLNEENDNKEIRLQNTKTGDDGSFYIKHRDFPQDKKYTIKYHDADGEANGGDFEDMSQNVEFKDEVYTGGSGNWYKGEVKKTANAVLTLKDNGNK